MFTPWKIPDLAASPSGQKDQRLVRSYEATDFERQARRNLTTEEIGGLRAVGVQR